PDQGDRAGRLRQMGARAPLGQKGACVRRWRVGAIPAALAKWEPGQLELGQRLLRRVKEMGTRSQVDCTWVPGDPDLRFGLYAPGQ
ncbi:hypothetical protein ABZ260_33675, partial [Streptosporangium sp. NPDC006013]|uniref:hypothetical protein n=1 Tax=Streptosporangium sp. NPDC006013 TaxID=3155596 RepID=UPI0033A5C345